MATERTPLSTAGARWVTTLSRLGVAGASAYTVTLVLVWLRAATTVTLASGDRLAAAELLYFLSLSAVEFEATTGANPSLWPHALAFVGLLAAPPLLAAGYLLAARLGDGRPLRYAAVGAAVAVPYALVVGWRASAFGPETVTTATEVTLLTSGAWGVAFTPATARTATVDPVVAVVTATLLAAGCGALGGWFAGWVRT